MFFLQKNQELKDQLSKIKSLKLELIEEYDDCKTLINDIKNTQGKKLDLNKIEIFLADIRLSMESIKQNNHDVSNDNFVNYIKDYSYKKNPDHQITFVC